MKSLSLIGAVLVILGVLSFVVPISHTENHDVKIGDTKIGVQTQNREKVPTPASATLIGVGILAMIVGSRKD